MQWTMRVIRFAAPRSVHGSKLRYPVPDDPYRANVVKIKTNDDHTFRAPGISAYMENGGRLETAQQIANHETSRTTKLYGRREKEISLDEDCDLIVESCYILNFRRILFRTQNSVIETNFLTFVLVYTNIDQTGVFIPFEFVDCIVHQCAVKHTEAY